MAQVVLHPRRDLRRQRDSASDMDLPQLTLAIDQQHMAGWRQAIALQKIRQPGGTLARIKAGREILAQGPDLGVQILRQEAMLGDQPGGRRVLREILIKAHQTLSRPQVQAGLEFLAEDPPDLLALDLLQHPPDEEARHHPHQDGDDRHGHATQEPEEDGFEVDANHRSGPGQDQALGSGPRAWLYEFADCWVGYHSPPLADD